MVCFFNAKEVMALLTDKQKKKMIADWVECQNYSAVARRFKVSKTTVRRVVEADNSTSDLVRQKKDENTQAVLDHMESLIPKVNATIDKLLEALNDETKIRRAGLMQAATTLGIIVDKWTGITDLRHAEEAEDSGVIILAEVKNE